MEKKSIKTLISEFNTGRINDTDCCMLAAMLFEQPDNDRNKTYAMLEKASKRRFPMATSNLGCCYLCDGAYNAACEKLKLALTLNDKLAKTHAALGTAYIRLGKYDEAINELTTAVSSWQEAGAYANLAAAYYHAGKLEEAEKYCDMAVIKNAGGSLTMQISYNLAVIEAALGNHEKAISAADAAAGCEENDRLDKHDLARVYYLLGEYEKVCAIVPESKVAVIPDGDDFTVYACSLAATGKRELLSSYFTEVSDYFSTRKKEALYDATEQKYEAILNDFKQLYSVVTRGEKPSVKVSLSLVENIFLY